VIKSRKRPSSPEVMSVTVMMTGVAAHKIRRFEEFGLCNPARTGSKQRLYSDNDVELIREIAVLEEEGINLPGVKTILSMKKFKGVKSVLPNRKE
jgi:MerR family transcriptional regulator, glutamine synthetase repressor